MIILGIDPGIGKVGWGLIKDESGKQKAIDYGCFETSPKINLDERLAKIYDFITQLIDKFTPEVLAIEQLYFAANSKTALIVGQARGVILSMVGAILHLPKKITQDDAADALAIAITAAKKRTEAMEHTLLYGPPGLGKTTLAHLIAKGMGSNIRITSGPAIERAGDLAATISEDIGTIEEVIESYLMQVGFLKRTSRGRVALSQLICINDTTRNT